MSADLDFTQISVSQGWPGSYVWEAGAAGGLILPPLCPATFPRSSRFVLSQPREESVSEREVWFSPAARWGAVWGVTRGGASF